MCFHAASFCATCCSFGSCCGSCRVSSTCWNVFGTHFFRGCGATSRCTACEGCCLPDCHVNVQSSSGWACTGTSSVLEHNSEFCCRFGGWSSGSFKSSSWGSNSRRTRGGASCEGRNVHVNCLNRTSCSRSGVHGRTAVGCSFRSYSRSNAVTGTP